LCSSVCKLSICKLFSSLFQYLFSLPVSVFSSSLMLSLYYCSFITLYYDLSRAGKNGVTWRSSWDYKAKVCKVRALQLLAKTWVPSICWSFCQCSNQWLQWWETTWAPDVWRAPEECASAPCQASWTPKFHIHSWKTHELLHVSVCQVFSMDCCIKVLLGFV
jgi:hypothetical protein